MLGCFIINISLLLFSFHFGVLFFTVEKAKAFHIKQHKFYVKGNKSKPKFWILLLFYALFSPKLNQQFSLFHARPFEHGFLRAGLRVKGRPTFHSVSRFCPLFCSWCFAKNRFRSLDQIRQFEYILSRRASTYWLFPGEVGGKCELWPGAGRSLAGRE